jgi:hypothetical protein
MRPRRTLTEADRTIVLKVDDDNRYAYSSDSVMERPFVTRAQIIAFSFILVTELARPTPLIKRDAFRLASVLCAPAHRSLRANVA